MSDDQKYVETPLMKQYYNVKSKHPDAILLFRVGDFYETFGTDAIKASEILGITLTRRANGSASFVELAGFPYHALDTYLPRLVRAGQRVAICEQLEDPKLAKKIVKRELPNSLHREFRLMKMSSIIRKIIFLPPFISTGRLQELHFWISQPENSLPRKVLWII